MRREWGAPGTLEEQADEILRADAATRQQRHFSQDILTESMWLTRWHHEVYCTDGYPDEAIYRGIFKRAANPVLDRLNSTDAQPHPRGSRPQDPG